MDIEIRELEHDLRVKDKIIDSLKKENESLKKQLIQKEENKKC